MYVSFYNIFERNPAFYNKFKQSKYHLVCPYDILAI